LFVSLFLADICLFRFFAYSLSIACCMIVSALREQKYSGFYFGENQLLSDFIILKLLFSY